MRAWRIYGASSNLSNEGAFDSQEASVKLFSPRSHNKRKELLHQQGGCLRYRADIRIWDKATWVATIDASCKVYWVSGRLHPAVLCWLFRTQESLELERWWRGAAGPRVEGYFPADSFRKDSLAKNARTSAIHHKRKAGIELPKLHQLFSKHNAS